MLGEAYAIVHGSGTIGITMILVAVLLLSLDRRIKGTAFTFYFLKLVALFGFCMLMGVLNVHSMRMNELLTKEMFYEEEGSTIQAGGSLKIQPKESLEIQAEGKITDIKSGMSNNKVYMSCKRIMVSGDGLIYEGNIKTFVYVKDVSDLKIGMKIVILGTAVPPETASNPGEFNAEEYYKNKGIYFFIYNGSVIQKDNAYSHIRDALYRFRESSLSFVDNIFSSEHAGIAKAMLLGDKTDIEEDTKRLYQKNGIAHILAISGLHITLLGMSLFRLLKKYIGSYYVSGGITILIIMAYGMMTGLAISTQRAVIMIVIDIAGRAIGRSSDMLTSLGMSCILVCLFEPYVVMDVGFLLSFGAIFAIATVYPVLKTICGKISEQKIVSALLVSISVNIITTPVIIYFFYEIPLYGILINFFVVPLVSVLILIMVFAVLIAFISIGVAEIFAIPAELILSFYEFLGRIFENLPAATINTGRIAPIYIVLYYVLTGVILYMLLHLRKRPSVFLKSAVVCVFLMLMLVVFKSVDKEFKVVFLDVGQGDGILIQTDMGTNILIDGGSSSDDKIGEYGIMPAIKYYGMSQLDYVFISHGDKDHTSGIEYLIKAEHTGIRIKNLVVAKYGEMNSLVGLINLAQEKGINIIYFDVGSYLYENEDFKLKCIYPYKASLISGNSDAEKEPVTKGTNNFSAEKEPVTKGTNNFSAEEEPVTKDANNLSMVLRLEAYGITILFTGDIGYEAEKEILDMGVNIDCNIIKVAHHGSKNSSSIEFLKKSSPEYAVISCGENNIYGHPHPDVLTRIEDQECMILTTKDFGAIVLYIEDGEMKISTYGRRGGD